MKNKNIAIILYVLVVVYAITYLNILYKSSVAEHTFIVGDWLINFKAGFVRRGLSGFLIIGLSDMFGIRLNMAVFYFQSIIFIIYIIFFLIILRQKSLHFWVYIICLSPVVFLFPIYDTEAVGRKENILFLLYVVFLYLLEKQWLKNYLAIIIYSVLIFIAVFFHELIFFFTPYFILAAYFYLTLKKEKWVTIFRYAFLVIIPLLAIISIYFFGKKLDILIICNELIIKGLSKEVCYGAIFCANGFGYKDNLLFALKYNYFFTYSINFVLGIIPFIFLFEHIKTEILNFKRVICIFIIIMFFSAPLFIMAIDWGRWLHIHFMMLFFTFLILLPHNTYSLKNDSIKIPALFQYKSTLLTTLYTFIFSIITICYLILWRMYTCFNFSIFRMDIIKDLF